MSRRGSRSDRLGRSELPSLNPYRKGLGLIARRLKWDLTPAFWRSRSALRALRNSHVGESAVIVCNGPSLLKSDLSLLEGVFSFGLNKVNLLFEHTRYRPSCVVAVNEHVLKQNAAFFNTTDLPLFLDSSAVKWVKPRPHVHYLHSVHLEDFSSDCSRGIFQGNTVTYVALQIAFHFGFSRVALIGADHRFSATGPPNSHALASKVDVDHFDPNYFAGVPWNLPDLNGSERSYLRARQRFELAGRRVFNATEGGHLEIFERTELKRFVAGQH